MATKKQQTADALLPKAKGWETQLGVNPPAKPAEEDKGALKRKTYLLSDELIKRLDDTAKAHGVGVSELLRYLITHSLNQVDNGTHKLPVKVVTTYTLDV